MISLVFDNLEKGNEIMYRIKWSDGIIGQIVIFPLFCVNKIPREKYADNELLTNILLSIRHFNEYIMFPIDWTVVTSTELTTSYMAGFLGLILGFLVVGFAYGSIVGVIIRYFFKLFHLRKKPKSTM